MKYLLRFRIALKLSLIFLSVNQLFGKQSPPMIEWEKSFGGSKDDKAFSIKQTRDSGFIVAGYTASNDGDVMGNHGAEKCPGFSNSIWKAKFNGKNVMGEVQLIEHKIY